jgi:endogenous inhibitor of DNA gyrase (YacG/DUF329 family)
MTKDRKFVRCPYCNTVHGWTPDDAFFDVQQPSNG